MRTNILRFQLCSTSRNNSKTFAKSPKICTPLASTKDKDIEVDHEKFTRTPSNTHVSTSNIPCYWGCFEMWGCLTHIIALYFLLKKTLRSIIPHTNYFCSYLKGNSFQGSQCIRDSCIAQLPAETSERCRCGSCMTWIMEQDNPKHLVSLLFPLLICI